MKWKRHIPVMMLPDMSYFKNVHPDQFWKEWYHFWRACEHLRNDLFIYFPKEHEFPYEDDGTPGREDVWEDCYFDEDGELVYVFKPEITYIDELGNVVSGPGLNPDGTAITPEQLKARAEAAADNTEVKAEVVAPTIKLNVSTDPNFKPLAPLVGELHPFFSTVVNGIGWKRLIPTEPEPDVSQPPSPSNRPTRKNSSQATQQFSSGRFAVRPRVVNKCV